MFKISRIKVVPAQNSGNSNILEQYEIQKASWIWHPDYLYTEEPHVVNFECKFETGEENTCVAEHGNASFGEKDNEEITVHVSADNRYELFLDGELISRGPDRCDLFHWSFASYKIQLSPGKHKLSAHCWWLGKEAPAAQQTLGRGGFIFAAEGKYGKILNTGCGNWRVAIEPGWSFENEPFLYVGSLSTIDAKEYNSDRHYAEPQILIPPVGNDYTGQIRDGWRLFPSSLPDQIFKKINTGKVRAVYNHDSFLTHDDITSPQINKWQNFFNNNESIVIPANHSIKVLIDLEDYYCAYSNINLSDGENAIIKIFWAEALFKDIDSKNPIVKENRNEILDKFYFGRADTIIQDGSLNSEYKNIWWRSGRYILLDITTKNEKLTFNKFSLYETGYPLENKSLFECSNSEINNIIPLAVRGMQMCSHETFMDCPYYEQLMYVGDSRLEMLVTHVMTNDDRLVKRGIELFDWSRYSTGFIHERYPSTPQQLSLTFSMIWIATLKDYTWWRDDKEWVIKRMSGMRSLLNNIMQLRNSDGLLENLPGWSFIDWVPGWDWGLPKDARYGVSSIINLFFVMSLKSAADIEYHYGEKFFSEYYSKTADKVSQKINDIFWNTEKGLFADDIEHTSFSEHAQCLALINNAFCSAQQEEILIQSLLSTPDLYQTTVYFSFHLLETFFKYKKDNELIKKLDFWKQLKKQGFKTPVEMPEPSRSDCHAWGSHPLFHFHASIAGIRPASPGFNTVMITPNPGNLESIKSSFPVKYLQFKGYGFEPIGKKAIEQFTAPPLKCGLPFLSLMPLKVSPQHHNEPPGISNELPPSCEIT